MSLFFRKFPLIMFEQWSMYKKRDILLAPSCIAAFPNWATQQSHSLSCLLFAYLTLLFINLIFFLLAAKCFHECPWWEAVQKCVSNPRPNWTRIITLCSSLCDVRLLGWTPWNIVAVCSCLWALCRRTCWDDINAQVVPGHHGLKKWSESWIARVLRG